MKNIEFKAELRNLELAKAICHAVCAKRIAALLQTDEYVAVPEGRLKRRVERNEESGAVRDEWLWYDRPDRTNARASVGSRLPRLSRKPTASWRAPCTARSRFGPWRRRWGWCRSA